VYLIVTNKRDLTSDFVVLELQRRGLKYFRLNTEDVAGARFSTNPSNSDNWRFTFPNDAFDTADVKAAYYRRPGRPEPMAGLQDAAQIYSVGEWQASLQSLYWALDGRWLNAPHLIALAENKVRQLMAAQTLGLKVPDSWLTNDPETFRSVLRRGGTVGKTLRNALVQDESKGKVIFTTRLKDGRELDPLSIQASPMLLQPEIAKRFDIRVTVVGEQVFAASIDSQAQEETQVDWRRTSRLDLPHRRHELPPDLARQCVQLTGALGLRFGAVDFVLDQEGAYWFLEINPNGQWGWIETRTGWPIAAAIVSELESISQ
jgi:glutathione synthase/RimK-type ligase-like ATP-grasp enzyme